jgi:hypothetical protein
VLSIPVLDTSAYHYQIGSYTPDYLFAPQIGLTLNAEGTVTLRILDEVSDAVAVGRSLECVITNGGKLRDLDVATSVYATSATLALKADGRLALAIQAPAIRPAAGVVTVTIKDTVTGRTLSAVNVPLTVSHHLWTGEHEPAQSAVPGLGPGSHCRTSGGADS